MPALTRSVRGSSTQLLYHVLEEPQLMAAVRELPASALVRLIHHVGLEDAGELIALTTTQQLSQVFDAELWQAREPGSDESFRPERFALFLRLLYEAGETFVVERLLAMPRELLTLAIHKLLLVIDIDALTVRFASSGTWADDSIDRVTRAIDEAQFEEWEEFRLIARDAEAFEDVWNALLALDRENHELVRYVIERCCDMDGELIEESGLYAVLNEDEMLENDLAGERRDRRAAAGFVTPADARAFLELARRETIDAAPDGRDPISRAYFRELAPEEPKAVAERALPTRAGEQPDVGRLLAVLREAKVFDDDPDATISAKLTGAGAARSLAGSRPRSSTESRSHPAKARDSAKGKDVVGKSGKGDVGKSGKGDVGKSGKGKRKMDVVDALAAQPALSERHESDGAEESDGKRLTLMASSLLVLRERAPARHAQRSEELGFLANVLLAGSRHDGRTYRPVEAIECALAVCSVGIERFIRDRAILTRDVAAPTAAKGSELLNEHSADQLFRAGSYALHITLVEPARAAVAQLLGAKLVDVPAALSGGSTSLIPLLDLEGPVVIALAALAEPEPWLAGGLASGDHIFIASQSDVQNARNFLAMLTDRDEHRQ